MAETTAAQRRHRRVALGVPVSVSSIDPETDPATGRPCFRASREWCENLSRGGACLRTADRLEPGRRVLVEFHLPGHPPVAAVGRVAWSRRVLGESEDAGASGVGVEFVGGAPDQLTALERFLERCEPSGTTSAR
jgi:uncharacterized protein (TIGR02266 family)